MGMGGAMPYEGICMGMLCMGMLCMGICMGTPWGVIIIIGMP